MEILKKNKSVFIVIVIILIAIFAYSFAMRTTGPTMQLRVKNISNTDFNYVWVGVGGPGNKITAYGSLDSGEISKYKDVSIEYWGYGKLDVTDSKGERLPIMTILSPDEGGPIFEENKQYTLLYNYIDGEWVVVFEDD